MRVLLIDGDRQFKKDRSTSVPNLALMKLSAYHRSIGDTVGFDVAQPDKIVVSTVFSWNAALFSGLEAMHQCPIEIGGSGYDLAKALPHEVEHIKPDYDLYGIDYSMGFTSRGCPNRCPFCVVPEKEGRIRDHAPLGEFVRDEHRKVMLLDNNFLASPAWKRNLQDLIDRALKVNFNQGLDVRLLTEENAAMLAQVDYSNHNWNDKRLIFAFDSLAISQKVIDGVTMLGDAGIKPRHLMFYVLAGYNTTFEEDYMRFHILKGMNVDPFIMPYRAQGARRRLDPLVAHFARFVNKRLYRTRAFDEYARLTPAQRRNVATVIGQVEAAVSS